MIINGRSPTMRHVSRTHRVAVDWSFGRINLDPKIQIKYVDTKQKPTLRHTDKGQFHTWWVEPSSPSVQYQHFSSASCPQTMSNRIQEWTVEERKMANSRPTLQLVSKNVASFSTAPSSSASNVPMILKATSQSLSLRECMRRDLQLKIQIKMTQRRVLKCGKQMQRRTQVRGDLRLKAQVSSTLIQCGQTISIYLLITSHTLRKSVRIYDKNWS